MWNLTRIKIHNFVYLHDVDIRFNKNESIFICAENKDASVASSNGAGKSLIPDSICYNIHDKIVRGSGKNSVIGINDNYTDVVTWWANSKTKNRIKIRRCRNHPKHKDNAILYLYKNNKWNTITKGTEKTNKKIEELFGLTYIVSQNTVFFTDNYDRFVTSRSSGRETLFLKILDIDNKIKKAKNKSAKEYKGIKEDYDKLFVEKKELKSSISTLKEVLIKYKNDIEKQKKLVEEDKEKKFLEFIKEIHLKEEELSVCEAYELEIEFNLKKYRERLISITEKIDKKNLKLDFLNSHITSCVDKLQDYHKKSKEYNILLRKISREDSYMIGKECRECGKVIRKKDLKKYIVRIEEKREIQYKAKEEFKGKLNKLKKEKKLLDISSDKIRSKKNRYKGYIDKLKEERIKNSSQQKVLNRDIDLLDDRIDELDLQEDDSINDSEQRIKEIAFEIETKKKEIDELDNNISLIEKNLHISSFWKKSFGRGGFRDVLVGDKIKELSQIADNNISEITDGGYIININRDSQKSLSKIYIDVSDNCGKNNSREYITCSKGEKARIRVSIGMAIDDICFSNMGLIVFDEDLDGVDGVGVDRIIDFLGSHYSDKQIMMLSHDDSMVSKFDRRIKLVRENNKTFVE